MEKIKRVEERMKQIETVQPEGNYYDKYHSKNKIERILMNNFFRQVERVLTQGGGKPRNYFGSRVWRRTYNWLY